VDFRENCLNKDCNNLDKTSTYRNQHI
jgi:hypothetical protein